MLKRHKCTPRTVGDIDSYVEPVHHNGGVHAPQTIKQRLFIMYTYLYICLFVIYLYIFLLPLLSIELLLHACLCVPVRNCRK